LTRVRAGGHRLEHTQGKVAAAAQLAAVNRVSLYRMLRRHGLKPG